MQLTRNEKSEYSDFHNKSGIAFFCYMDNDENCIEEMFTIDFWSNHICIYNLTPAGTICSS